MNVYEFSSYPNQKRIKINKTQVTQGNFCTINTGALINASKILTPGAFKLYLYFSLNADGFEFWLSRAHVCDTMGISPSTYKAALKELIDKGFLEQSENKLKYIFNEFPV